MNYFYDILIPLFVAFLVAVICCPIMIPFLHKLKFGQNVRDDGPESHLKKAGTPTMGGIMIMFGVISGSLVSIIALGNKKIIPALVLMLGFGIVGFIDDFIKVVKKRSLGLRAWQKLILQFVFTGGFVAADYWVRGSINTKVIIPFTSMTWDMPMWFYMIFLVIVVLGTVNGVNFTDGLDGLASSVTCVVSTFFVIAAVQLGQSENASISAIVLGSLLAFLIFNAHPAKVFMGDTGSLALGGYVAAIAIVMQMHFFIIIVGLIYLVEVISVIIQVGYFKITHGKRIFKMAPIHHHFELCGCSEIQVVTAFTVITALLCGIGYQAIKMFM